MLAASVCRPLDYKAVVAGGIQRKSRLYAAGRGRTGGRYGTLVRLRRYVHLHKGGKAHALKNNQRKSVALKKNIQKFIHSFTS